MEGHRSTEFFHRTTMRWRSTTGLRCSHLRDRAPVRLRHRRDGSWLWFEVTNNNLLEDPDYGCVVCEMVDISEEMAREQFLDDSPKQSRSDSFRSTRPSHRLHQRPVHEILGVSRRPP